MKKNRWREAVALVCGVALTAGLLVVSPLKPADANHEPANKYAAAGSAIDDIPPNAQDVVLEEVMRVSTPYDLLLQVSAECTILTALQTGEQPLGTNPSTDATDRARAEGKVELHITIDGNPVPVSSVDRDPSTPGVQTDDGRVTFCNRVYQRTVTDSETPPGDGLDTEEDFIRTRAANSFNWMALDVGRYDVPNMPAGTGTNVIEIEVHARYTKTATDTTQQDCGTDEPEGPVNRTCARAYVGKRTLVAEPTNLSVHERVEPAPNIGG